LIVVAEATYLKGRAWKEIIYKDIQFTSIAPSVGVVEMRTLNVTLVEARGIDLMDLSAYIAEAWG